MKTRLLKQLRRAAKKYIKIEVEDDGLFLIINTRWSSNNYLHEDEIWGWCFGNYINYFYTIDEAIEKLSMARRLFILYEIKRIKEINYIQHVANLIRKRL